MSLSLISNICNLETKNNFLNVLIISDSFTSILKDRVVGFIGSEYIWNNPCGKEQRTMLHFDEKTKELPSRVYEKDININKINVIDLNTITKKESAELEKIKTMRKSISPLLIGEKDKTCIWGIADKNTFASKHHESKISQYHYLTIDNINDRYFDIVYDIEDETLYEEKDYIDSYMQNRTKEGSLGNKKESKVNINDYHNQRIRITKTCLDVIVGYYQVLKHISKYLILKIGSYDALRTIIRITKCSAIMNHRDATNIQDAMIGILLVDNTIKNKTGNSVIKDSLCKQTPSEVKILSENTKIPLDNAEVKKWLMQESSILSDYYQILKTKHMNLFGSKIR